MQLQNGGGDKLARGLSRAAFPPAGGNITQEKWDAMWVEETPTEAPKPVECHAFYGADDICGLPEDSPIHKSDNPNGHQFVPTFQFPATEEPTK